MVFKTRLAVLALGASFLGLFCLPSSAQVPNLHGIGPVTVRARITQAVNPRQVVTLRGNVNPLARAQYDQGAAPDSLPAERMMLLLQRSPEQQAALDKLIQEQQTKGSPNYHNWLTPQQFGQLFGPADADINTITNWLTSNGFQINKVAAGRNVIEFSGTAGQVRQAFGTQIHEYDINGRQHWANVTDPQIPAALAPVVAGVVSMSNFRRKPMSHRVAADIPVKTAVPEYTTSSGYYAVVPYDFATIYNVLPLWNDPSRPINGFGQSIAIVGRTNIDPTEVATFRSKFGLPPNAPNVILNGPDPGIVDGESTEAYLDVEWSGAVAPQAKINFVVTYGTITSDGVDLSAQYIVDNNISPVMSVSFGSCESGMGSAGRAFYNSLWEQAAAQGITVSVSAGDNGSAGCDDPTNNGSTTYVAASGGLAVNGIASTPFNVALGGTDFDQTPTTYSTYWKPAAQNDPTTRASALSYIPEVTWNESCAQSGTPEQPSANCSAATISANGIWAGSGGRSGYNSKPAWQSGSGVPPDGQRDLPDVSLFSSSGGNKSFYLICDGNCNDPTSPTFSGVGGTSAAAPAFAGIMALVNQKMAARQGNANFALYNLAAQESYSSCNSSTVGTGTNSCVFYDITKGNISVPCKSGSNNCGTSGAVTGILVDPNAPTTPAFTTKSAYDLATGLGSINVTNLVNKWSTAAFTPTTTTITNLNPTSLTHGATANLTITVNPSSGSGTPSGDIGLVANYGDHSVGFDQFTLPQGAKTTTVSTTALPGGQYNVVAHYAGDGTFASSDSAGTAVNVAAQASSTFVSLVAIDYTGNTISKATTAVYGSPYILRMWVTDGTAITSLLSTPCGNSNPATCPTGNITLTDGGTALDGGTFSLAGDGYVDDQNIQLPGGTHTIAASYQGDSSYLPSGPATTTVTITPASTTIAAPVAPGSATTNTNVNISATVTAANSNGAAPGGTVTFYDGGTAMTGSITYAGTDFTASTNTPPNTVATITTKFTTTGTHQIAAQYNGDSNYQGTGKSTATTVTVTQSAGPVTHLGVSAPGTATIGTPFNFTVTALDASNMTNTGYTGTVHFTSTDSSATLPPDATLTNGTGTFSATLNASGTFTITGTDTVTSSVTGTSTPITASVAAADFTMSAAPASGTVVKGSSGTSTITVASTNGFASTVALTCSVSPAVSKGPTCTVSPASVNPTSATPATPTLTVSTTADTVAALHKGFGWTLASGSGVFAFVLFGIPGLRRRGAPSFAQRRVGLLLLLIGMTLVSGMVACGGGGSSGGGHTTIPGTPSGTYSVTVTGTSGSLTHTTTYTVTVP
jgi:hypothetical protein